MQTENVKAGPEAGSAEQPTGPYIHLRPLPSEAVRSLSALPPEQLAEIIGRKDTLRDRADRCAHRAWALAWLAAHAWESGKVTYDEEHYRDAVDVVLDEVVHLLAKTRVELERHSGVRYRVCEGSPEPAS